MASLPHLRLYLTFHDEKFVHEHDSIVLRSDLQKCTSKKKLVPFLLKFFHPTATVSSTYIDTCAIERKSKNSKKNVPVESKQDFKEFMASLKVRTCVRIVFLNSSRFSKHGIPKSSFIEPSKAEAAALKVESFNLEPTNQISSVPSTFVDSDGAVGSRWEDVVIVLSKLASGLNSSSLYNLLHSAAKLSGERAPTSTSVDTALLYELISHHSIENKQQLLEDLEKSLISAFFDKFSLLSIHENEVFNAEPSAPSQNGTTECTNQISHDLLKSEEAEAIDFDLIKSEEVEAIDSDLIKSFEDVAKSDFLEEGTSKPKYLTVEVICIPKGPNLSQIAITNKTDVPVLLRNLTISIVNCFGQSVFNQSVDKKHDLCPNRTAKFNINVAYAHLKYPFKVCLNSETFSGRIPLSLDSLSRCVLLNSIKTGETGLDSEVLNGQKVSMASGIVTGDKNDSDCLEEEEAGELKKPVEAMDDLKISEQAIDDLKKSEEPIVDWKITEGFVGLEMPGSDVISDIESDMERSKCMSTSGYYSILLPAGSGNFDDQASTVFDPEEDFEIISDDELINAPSFG